MGSVVFIDTSILCNLIPVPGKNQHQAQVQKEMKERLAQGAEFTLPITAVIETGNFVAQLADGHERLTTANQLEKILRFICEGKAP